MTRFWRYLLNGAGALVFLLAAALGIGLAAPFLGDSLRGVLAEFDGDRGVSGLIYVESPEVYTRQRLVNDRYLQDAWLRAKLTEIDDPGAVWIDTIRVASDRTAVALSAGDQAGAGATSPPALAGLDAVPLSFEDEFTLQSNARDTIRQMILENALDDRHDLSGNTVFGLKFDTAILPGSRARLNPTVIVTMNANPLEELKKSGIAVSDLVAHYNLSGWSGNGDRALDDAVTRVLIGMDSHFNAWRGSLEERLNQQRGIEASRCGRDAEAPAAEADGSAPAGAAVRANPVTNAGYLERPLCFPPGGGGFSAEAAAEAATGDPLINRDALRAMLNQRGTVDAALGFVLRLPERNLKSGDRLLNWVYAKARTECGAGAGGDATVRSLFEPAAGSDELRHRSPIAQPWAPMFELELSPRLGEESDSCGAELDISLRPLSFSVLLIPQDQFAEAGEARVDEVDAALYQSRLTPYNCTDPGCGADGYEVWIESRNRDAVAGALDQEILGGLIADAVAARQDGAAETRCFLPGFFYAPADPGDRAGAVCAEVFEADFQSGAFHFLRSMYNVETYTYAAFPRGDVSGVVSETGTLHTAGGRVSLGDTGTGIQIGRGSAERGGDAEPSMINFASGARSQELFDFGWSVVKNGVKEPMTASQLVLVSVPAYVDEITLDVYKGFLDPDELPADWTEYRALTLDGRIERLFEGYEQRRITLKVPPDYAALDGIIGGSTVMVGPRINDSLLGDCIYRALNPNGAGYAITIDIPGERLWRSTVVTLAGHKADRIEVMPDMRGILASFDRFPFANASQDIPLSVWTSEGNDQAKVSFCAAP